MSGLSFPVVGLRFHVQFERHWQLPDFPGSLLRGAFGAALRHLSCMTGFRSCDGCPLLDSCPYPELFAPPPRDLSAVGLARLQQGVPPPYILQLPEQDVSSNGQLVFGMRLVGKSVARLHYVVEAWRRALARGIGSERVRGLLLRVADEQTGACLWADGTDIEAPALLRLPRIDHGDLQLRTQSPLRLQARGRMLAPAALQPRLFVAAIIRRARLLAIHADSALQQQVRAWPVDCWLAEADAIAHTAHFARRDWYRWSARQQQRMNLGGLAGFWLWQDVPDAIAALLALGSLLHVGKEASFGLGAYRLIV